MPPKQGRTQYRGTDFASRFPDLLTSLLPHARTPTTMRQLLFHRRMNGHAESFTGPLLTFYHLPTDQKLEVAWFSRYILTRALGISHEEWRDWKYGNENGIYVVFEGGSGGGSEAGFEPAILVRDGYRIGGRRGEGQRFFRLWRDGEFGKVVEVEGRVEGDGGGNVIAASAALAAAAASVTKAALALIPPLASPIVATVAPTTPVLHRLVLNRTGTVYEEDEDGDLIDPRLHEFDSGWDVPITEEEEQELQRLDVCA
jgi:hypothetical protein